MARKSGAGGQLTPASGALYDWLRLEMQRIRTPQFHVVAGPPDPAIIRQAAEARGGLPPSFRQFAMEFGDAKLYRTGAAYLIGVHAVPLAAAGSNGEGLRCIGHYDDRLAYFLEKSLLPDKEAAVLEWYSNGLREVAASFAEWLRRRADEARRSFGKKRWARIEEGPRPFSPEELEVVRIRSLFRWSVVGVTPSGDTRFSVTNGSDGRLPFLSIGVRSKDGRMSGAVWLPVASIAPGMTSLIDRPCYKGLIAPDQTEFFALHDPGPEERDQYWEFRQHR